MLILLVVEVFMADMTMNITMRNDTSISKFKADSWKTMESFFFTITVVFDFMFRPPP